MAINAALKLDPPKNEPVTPYRPNDPETASLKAELERQAGQTIEIPLVIGGEEVKTGNFLEIRAPHDHSLLLAKAHTAGEAEVNRAIEASQKAWVEWSETPVQHRLAIFMKMADRLTGPWRDRINAATMLGQSKTCHQSEIEAACELADFLRFNSYFALTNIYAEQPPVSGNMGGLWNYVDHRPLEGFVFAITPFNFTAIAGNLPTSPAMMGCVSLWKPASTAVLSNYYLMKLFEECGLPAGVINFLPGRGASVGTPVMNSPLLSGIHFTGSTAVFQNIWRTIGGNISNYKLYPRIVGETGGKDFIVMHESADVQEVVTAAVRGAYEYQGQKCSAASRMYVPKSKYNEVLEGLRAEIATLKTGDIRDFSNFMGAVIDEASFTNISSHLEYTKSNSGAEIVIGGTADRSKGWFVEPTVIRCDDPRFKTMEEEIFGPVLSIHPYDSWDEALELCATTSGYALTGAVFATDRYAHIQADKALRHCAGNYYINDKPTGAVVGQQPFGGGRASGTNDKAGSVLNLTRWVSPRTVKENHLPPKDYRYPFMG